MTGSAGGYQVGFQLTPLGPNGDLTAHDFKGGPHPVEKDPIFHLCTENREKGYGANKISCFVGTEPKDVVHNIRKFGIMKKPSGIVFRIYPLTKYRNVSCCPSF